jgi:hypothetical protein
LRGLVIDTGRSRPAPQRIARRALVIWVASLLPSAAAATSTDGPVADSGRCQRLLGVARSKADVLGSARLEAQAFRQPSVGFPTNPADVPERLEQVRAGISWSPVDRWRGARLVEAADWECIAEDARSRLLEILDQGDRYGRPSALRTALSNLDAAIPRADERLSEAAERQRRGIDTHFEVDALRSRIVALRSQREQWRGELAGLEVLGTIEAAGPLNPLLQVYEEASLSADRARSEERRLESWRTDLRVGAVPWPQPDWFGAVSLGWSSGAVAQAQHERRSVDGRARELAESKDELRYRLSTFEESLRRMQPALEAELTALREHAGHLRRRVAATPPEDEYRKVVDAMFIESMEVDARSLLLETLLSARRALLKGEGS